MLDTTNVVLTGGHLWDGVSDEVRRDAAVHIRPDGRIGDVGDPADVIASAPDAAVVDVAGAYLSPGLINMHVHFGLALPGKMADVVAAGGPSAMVLLMSGNATQTLEAGVTTVRLVGEPDFHDFALREAVNTGHVRGPRIFTAGHALCCTGGHGHDSDAMEADGADGFRRATRMQLRAGADLIKVCISGGIAGEHEAIDTPQLTDEEMAAVISTAHDWGRKVTAHAGPSNVIQKAIELGLDCVEHGYELTEEITASMAQNGVSYVPTITVSRCEQFFRDNGVPEWMIERALGAGPRHWQSLQHAIAAGVNIIMGTDMPPHTEYDGTTATVREMEFMQEAGMSAVHVMRSATSLAAEWLNANDLGRITREAHADLILTEDDPTADISALRGIHAVISRGSVVRDDSAVMTRGGTRA